MGKRKKATKPQAAKKVQPLDVGTYDGFEVMETEIDNILTCFVFVIMISL